MTSGWPSVSVVNTVTSQQEGPASQSTIECLWALLEVRTSLYPKLKTVHRYLSLPMYVCFRQACAGCTMPPAYCQMQSGRGSSPWGPGQGK